MRQLRTYFDRRSIRYQLFRLVLVVTTTALAIAMIGGGLIEWYKQQRQLSQSLATIAQAAGVAASAAIVFHDNTAAGEALRMLVAHKEIEAAAVYLPEGYRLASYGDAVGVPDSFGTLREHLPDFDLFLPATTLFQPIRFDDATIGHIFIRASLRDYRNNFLLQGALMAGAGLLGLLLAMGLGLRFLARIVKPVRELADTSRQVREEGNFSRRATPPASSGHLDEIGELVLNFNAMLAEIEQREHELAIYQNNLETMVFERTAALNSANRELLTAKEAAESATVTKSRFLAAASHDLRQPIQAINLFKDALNNTALNEEQQRISDYLSLSAQSLAELLNALLDISKLDAGAILASPQVIDVHELLSHIDAEFAPLAAARSLRFKYYYPPGDLAFFTDPKLLQSLLRNLIGNALKYTERGGILVAIRRRGDQAIMQVWDTGMGIAPEHLRTIFDEYFQVANPERDKTKGLGLGLAIARRQAKLLATEIVCRSRSGKGTVFEFRLPLASQAQKAEHASLDQEIIRTTDASGLLGRRIAVIDNDFMVAKAIQLSLESLGMHVKSYGSAEEALADSTIASADVYISDFRLPGASGVELLDSLQQLVKRPLRAVMLTGENSPGWTDLAQLVRWPVLFKPVDLPTLVATIEAQDAAAAGAGSQPNLLGNAAGKQSGPPAAV